MCHIIPENKKKQLICLLSYVLETVYLQFIIIIIIIIIIISFSVTVTNHVERGE